MNKQADTVAIVLNIGTPKTPSDQDVQSYLTEFLSDKDVINIPGFIRIPLVKFWIAPTRAKSSAAKYRKIWTEQGSPLRFHSQNFADALSKELGHPVLVGMRYGQPSILSALKQAQQMGAKNLILLPMYPQFAEATTGSSLRAVTKLLKSMNWNVETKVIHDFYNSEAFLNSSLAGLDVEVVAKNYDHVLFSFHGLPVSQIKKDKACQVGSCCDSEEACARRCYRAQTIATANLLAKKLKLKPESYSYSFQSRLGPVEWIGPYTDEVVEALAKKGVKRLLVFSPSFVADCLETLEEIGLEVRDIFKSNGGEVYDLHTCVNSNPEWIQSFAKLVQEPKALGPVF